MGIISSRNELNAQFWETWQVQEKGKGEEQSF